VLNLSHCKKKKSSSYFLRKKGLHRPTPEKKKEAGGYNRAMGSVCESVSEEERWTQQKKNPLEIVGRGLLQA